MGKLHTIAKGYRKGTRNKYAKKYRCKGEPGVSRYLVNFKRGDFVDIVVDGSIHKGMPYSFYHGKTGSPSTVNQSANLGVHAPLLDESCRGAVVGSVVGLTVVSMGGETLLTMASAPNAEVKTIKIAVQKAVPDSHVEKLVHEGDILHDMQTIEEVGIPNQAILQAVFGRMSARFEYETPSSWEHGRGRVNIEVAPGDLHGLEELRKKFPQPCELVEIDGGEILKIILDDAEGYYPQALEKQPEEAERLKSLLRCASSVMGFYHKHTSSAQWRCYDRISSLNALVSGHRVSIVKNRFAVPE